jgi:hypothetical protein
MAFPLSTHFLDRQGRPIQDGDSPATVRAVLFAIIDTPLPDDVQMTPGVKLRLAQLGMRVAAAEDEIALPAADVALLLDRAARVVSTLVYGQLVALMDPAQLESVG